jgi:hypothetical protein
MASNPDAAMLLPEKEEVELEAMPPSPWPGILHAHEGTLPTDSSHALRRSPPQKNDCDADRCFAGGSCTPAAASRALLQEG